MEYRLVGRTGIRVAPLALGCMNFGDATPPEESIRMIHRALDAGVNLLDTANMYGAGASEEVLGQALEGSRRQRAILATKAHFPMSEDPNDRGNSRRHLVSSVESSLRRLRTDWIDFLQLHRPDFHVNPKETLGALDDLVRQGKVRYVGTSTFPAWHLMEFLALSETYGWCRVASEQPPYNLLDRRIENELVPCAQRHDLALFTWSPLAMGLLAGRYDDAVHPPAGSRVARKVGVYAERVTHAAVERARKIAAVASDFGMTSAELSLLWVRDRPGVTAPILGPRTEAHLDLALSTLDRSLASEALPRLDALVPPGTAATNFFNNSGWMPRS